MAILAYEYNRGVADHHTMLEKLKDFAVARGWTAQEWYKNSVSWGETGTPGVYGWLAGSESYLRLFSAGYGSQNLQYRFSLADTGTNNNRVLTIGAFIENEGNDAASSIHPVNRNALEHANWNVSGGVFNLSSDPCDVWLFGNDKTIIAVIKYDNTYIQTLCFGSPELEDGAETQGNWIGLNWIGANPWYSKNYPCAFDNYYMCCYRDVLRGPGSDIFPSFVCDGANNKSNLGPGSEAGLLHANSYSDARSIVRQIIHLKDNDGLLVKNWGYHWAYRIWHRGMQIGEEYTAIAGEKYICFPWASLSLTSNNLGFAIRVE